jgi:hypothetical protein
MGVLRHDLGREICYCLPVYIFDLISHNSAVTISATNIRFEVAASGDNARLNVAGFWPPRE